MQNPDFAKCKNKTFENFLATRSLLVWEAPSNGRNDKNNLSREL